MTQHLPTDTVGADIAQLDSDEKLSGRAQYIADLSRPGMLHGAILQSPHAHALIKRYDLSAALALPGVRAIVTGADLDPAHRMGAFIKDEPALAQGKVRYVGEIVAAVAADTEAIARRAVRLIRVDYEPLPAVLTPADALAPGAPLVHEGSEHYVKVFDAGTQGNLCSRTSFTEGDVASAWTRCAVVVEDTFTTPAQAHVSLEPCGALAEPDAAVVGSRCGRPTSRSSGFRPMCVNRSACQ